MQYVNGLRSEPADLGLSQQRIGVCSRKFVNNTGWMLDSIGFF